MIKEPKILTSFYRYNIIAVIATITDFLVFIFLTEAVGMWYVAATMISVFTGGAVAFIFNRNWVFIRKDGKLTGQSVRYFMVWGGSIFLNTTGLYLMVEYTHLTEIVAKVFVSVIVGAGFNFLMNRYFVFRKPAWGSEK